MNKEESDFLLQQQRALERMREMNARSKAPPSPHKMPPSPSFVKIPKADSRDFHNNSQNHSEFENKQSKASENTNQKKDFISEFLSGDFSNMPILHSLKEDSDMALLLGLLLILYSEKSDRLLLMALLYIIM